MATVLRISEAASLAMHTVAVLASKHQAPFSTKYVASLLKASEAHLSKVLQRLTRAGLVKPIRGRKGGFLLAGDPSQLTLLQVFEAMEGPLKNNMCLLGSPICGNKCILGDLLEKVNATVYERLSNTYVKDLTLGPIPEKKQEQPENA